MTTGNPLEDVENRKGQQDLGVVAARIFQGALVESASESPPENEESQ